MQALRVSGLIGLGLGLLAAPGREVVPHALAFAALVGATICIDVALHLFGVAWVRRATGSGLELAKSGV
jgi:hypothetical protein